MTLRPHRAPTLFLGIGNVLYGDDGLGVRAAEVLASLSLPDTVEVVDAGTAGMELSYLIEQRELVLVVDAIDAGVEPGTILRSEPAELQPLVRTGLSLHDLHLLDAVAQTQSLGTGPRRVVIYAVQVRNLSLGIGLSPPVEQALPRVIEGVLEELGLAPQGVDEQAVRAAPTVFFAP